MSHPKTKTAIPYEVDDSGKNLLDKSLYFLSTGTSPGIRLPGGHLRREPDGPAGPELALSG
jgi:hypothetical protein